MPKKSSTKFYQINKENLQEKKNKKNAYERYQNLSKEVKEKKSNNMVIKDTKISQKIKKKNWLSIEKVL